MLVLRYKTKLGKVVGIIVNTLAIFLGTSIGSVLKKKFLVNKSAVFAISILIVSVVGFFENVFIIDENGLTSKSLIVIVLSLVLGAIIGEWLNLEDKLTANESKSAFMNTALFFAIGGMQISGAVLLGLTGDSSILILKSVVDFPFALMYGSLYGKSTILSALPVGVMQVLIAVASYFLGDFISDTCLRQLCAMGYIILFFSGYNLLVSYNKKVKSVNMLPSIGIIIIYNLILGFFKVVV